MRNAIFAERFGQLSDEAWLGTLIRSIGEPVIDGVEFPRFPSGEMQTSFVGSDGSATLREAQVFYSAVKGFARQLGGPLSPATRVIDFGCGWGRHYRFFLRDLDVANYVGVDLDADCVSVCNKTFPVGTFRQCSVNPPLDAEAGSVDLIYAYSVFSHLAGPVGLGWVKEFARVLRPGGLLVVTTLKRAHIDVWERLRQDASQPWWAEMLRAANFDRDRWQEAYETGEMLYVGTGGGGPRSSDFYGEAVVSPAYVRRQWEPHLRLVEHANDFPNAPQAIVVMRKA